MLKWFKSIYDIKQYSQDSGHHFFDEDTLEFFGSWVDNVIHLGHYFITAEYQGFGKKGPKRYTIRNIQASGNIETVGEFGEFETYEQARRVMSLIQDNEESEPYFPLNPYDYSFDLLFEIADLVSDEDNPDSYTVNDICERLGLEISWDDEQFFREHTDHSSHDRKKLVNVKVTCQGKEMLVPEFTGPIDMELDAHSLFATLVKSDPGTESDYCGEFGYSETKAALYNWQRYQDYIEYNSDEEEYIIETFSEYCDMWGYSRDCIKHIEEYEGVKKEYESYKAFMTEVFEQYPIIVKFFELIA